MRITDKMIFDQAATRTNSARERTEKATRQAATGMRVSHPGDDPAAAGMIVNRRADNIRLKAIEQSAGLALDSVVASDRILGSVLDITVRAKEIALELSNDVMGPDERLAASAEIDGLRRNAIAQLNTKIGDRYIFGGFLDGQTPFLDDGTYRGDDNVRKAEIAPGVYEAASVRADAYVKGAGLSGGVDILTTLKELSDALSTNDSTTARSKLGDLDDGISQLTQGRAMAGTSVNILETASSAAGAGRIEGEIQIGRLEDADIIESATNLQLAQRALEATLTASMKSFELTLLKAR